MCLYNWTNLSAYVRSSLAPLYSDAHLLKFLVPIAHSSAVLFLPVRFYIVVVLYADEYLYTQARTAFAIQEYFIADAS